MQEESIGNRLEKKQRGRKLRGDNFLTTRKYVGIALTFLIRNKNRHRNGWKQKAAARNRRKLANDIRVNLAR